MTINWKEAKKQFTVAPTKRDNMMQVNRTIAILNSIRKGNK